MKKKSLSFVLALAMIASLITGCGGNGSGGAGGSSGDASNGGANSGQGTAAAEKILYVTGGNAATLNPHMANSVESSTIQYCQGMLYDYFPNSTGDGASVEPELADAEPVDVNGDGLVWNIPINPDAKWDDGSPITAETFEYSYKMQLDPALLCELANMLADNQITILNATEYYTGAVKDWNKVGIKAIDGNILQLTLVVPANQLDVMRHFCNYFTAPVNEELYESCLSADRTNSTYGTTVELTRFCGPFRVEEWVQGSTIKMKRNENFVRSDKIHLDGIVEAVISNTATGIQMFENGKLDIIDLDTTSSAQYYEDPRFLERDIRYVRQIEICDSNTDYPILANINFKKALFYAVDRQTVAKLAYSTPACFAVPRTVVVDSEGTRFRDLPEVKAYDFDNYGYDPELAKQYFETALKEEKLTSVTLELLHSNSGVDNTMAEYLQEQFNTVFDGKLTLKLSGVPNNTRLSTIKSCVTDPKAYQLSFGYWALSASDYNPTKIFEVMTSTYGRRNAPYHSNIIDTLYSESQLPENRLDIKKLTELAIAMEKAYFDECVGIPVLEDVNTSLCAERVILPISQADTQLGWGIKYCDIVA